MFYNLGARGILFFVSVHACNKLRGWPLLLKYWTRQGHSYWCGWYGIGRTNNLPINRLSLAKSKYISLLSGLSEVLKIVVLSKYIIQ